MISVSEMAQPQPLTSDGNVRYSHGPIKIQPQGPMLTVPTRLQLIEQATRRTVSIKTKLNSETATICHPQTESPLFRLPAELRHEIFSFATLQYDDKRFPYKETAYYYRPDHHARHTISISLLLTCRLAWLEANRLPMRQAEHCFWFARSPYEVEQTEKGRWNTFFSSLTETNKIDLRHVHLFTQMYWAQGLGDSLPQLFGPLAKIPRLGHMLKTFKITIRHTDWWYWETDNPLKFEVAWVEALLSTPYLINLETFKLELETLRSKRDQMQPIVNRLSKLEGRARIADPATWTPSGKKMIVRDEPTVFTWSGPARINDQEYAPYKGLDKLDYHVVTLTWKPIKAPVSKEPILANPENTLGLQPIASAQPGHANLRTPQQIMLARQARHAQPSNANHMQQQHDLQMLQAAQAYRLQVSQVRVQAAMQQQTDQQQMTPQQTAYAESDNAMQRQQQRAYQLHAWRLQQQRARRLYKRGGLWLEGLSDWDKECIVREDNYGAAVALEDVRRAAFDEAFAKLEAERVLLRWREQGTLLKFADEST